MKTRCANPNVPCWESYGGRGIKICEEWFNSFEVFQAWAIDAGYQKHLTIDRRDNNAPQGYCPENCHWVTNEEQSRNKRNNHREEFLGETKTIAEWSRDERCAVSPGTFKGRIVQGWNMKDAFTTPAFYRGIKGGTLRCRDRAALKG